MMSFPSSPAAMLRALVLPVAAVVMGGASMAQPTSTSPTDASGVPTSPAAASTVTSISTSISVSTATATTTTTEASRIVPIFYIDERAFEGLPYTLLHRVGGSVAGVDDTATTFVITTTRMDLRPSTLTRTDNITTAIPTLRPTTRGWTYNATGPPSTITQGPTTFLFTGTRWGDPSRTIINQCRLNGTGAARCNLTHVGPIWYTNDANWNGTFRTYSYNWTSGDRYGFAPCTVTSGVELMGPPTLTATTSTNGAAGASRGGPSRTDEVRGLASTAGLFVAFIFGLFLLV